MRKISRVYGCLAVFTIGYFLSIGVSLFSFPHFFFNPFHLVTPRLSSLLSFAVSFLPTRDKSEPCCDSIARLFRINLTAGINQCDSSSVIPKESPDIYALKDPSIRGRRIGSHLWPFVCACILRLARPQQCVTAVFPRILLQTSRVRSLQRS